MPGPQGPPRVRRVHFDVEGLPFDSASLPGFDHVDVQERLGRYSSATNAQFGATDLLYDDDITTRLPPKVTHNRVADPARFGLGIGEPDSPLLQTYQRTRDGSSLAAPDMDWVSRKEPLGNYKEWRKLSMGPPTEVFYTAIAPTSASTSPFRVNNNLSTVLALVLVGGFATLLLA